MFNHSLMFIALLSFSIATTAAAVPMDVGQAAVSATQNADLHQDVAQDYQGGNSDKDVVNMSPSASTDAFENPQSISPVSLWFTSNDETNYLQPLAVLLVSIGVILRFVSRKSSSTK